MNPIGQDREIVTLSIRNTSAAFGIDGLMFRSVISANTDADIAARVPDVGLAAVARAYAKIIDKVNKLDRKDLQPILAPSTK
jgi:hypothetical protein